MPKFVFSSIDEQEKFTLDKVSKGAKLSGNFPSVTNEGKYDGSLELLNAKPQFVTLVWTVDKTEQIANGAIMTLKGVSKKQSVKPIAGIFVTLKSNVMNELKKPANYTKSSLVEAKASKNSGKVYCTAVELN